MLALSNYQTSPAFPSFPNSLAFDLTRLTEDGLAAGHWDVLEELGAADKSRAF